MDRVPLIESDRTLGEVVTEVSEKASLLVREEIELAKAEVTQKVSQLARGAVVAAAAGFFVLLGLIFAFHTIAWLLNRTVFGSVWLGFLVTTLGILLLAGVAGLVAARALKRGAPPVPTMAIDEAKRTRDELGARVAS